MNKQTSFKKVIISAFCILLCSVVFLRADEIDKLMESYQGLMLKSSVMHDTDVKNLSEKYIIAVNQARGRIQRSENPANMKYAIAELQRYIKEQTLPKKTSHVPELAQAQAFFMKKEFELRARKATEIITASEQYHKALKMLAKELTKREDFPAAEAVMEELKSAQQIEELVEARKLAAEYKVIKDRETKERLEAAEKKGAGRIPAPRSR